MSADIKSLKTYFLYPGVEARNGHRCVTQFRGLKALGYDARLVAYLTRELVDEADILALYGPYVADVYNYSEFPRKKGKRLIVDVDEDVVLSPWADRHDPAAAATAAWAAALVRDADVVSASTPFLAAQLRAFNDSVVVQDSLVDDRVWESERRVERADVGIGPDDVVVGWVGTPDNVDDVRAIATAVEDAVRGDASVRLLIVGFDPGFLAVPSERKTVIPFERPYEYVGALRLIDIALLPREGTLANRCRSGLRLLEHGMAESAVIASATGAYAGLRDAGAPVSMVEDSAEWSVRLDALIADAEVRLQSADALGAFVRERYTLSSNAAACEAALLALGDA